MWMKKTAEMLFGFALGMVVGLGIAGLMVLVARAF